MLVPDCAAVVVLQVMVVVSGVLGGSWDLVSTVIGTLTGVITNYNYSYLVYNHSY